VSRLRLAGRADLIFLVDSSASVGATNFRDEIRFIRKLLADFTVSADDARVALVTFSSVDKVVTRVDQLRDGGDKCTLMLEDFPAVDYEGGGTYTLGALRRAQEILSVSVRATAPAPNSAPP